MRRLLGLALVLALVAGFAPSAFAQTAWGNIYGNVTDASGAILPGAIVTLEGPAGTQTTTVGEQGDFRFLRVDSGSYTLKVALTGFTTATRAIRVTTGENINVTFPLGVASVEETITVTAETPLVDIKKRGTSTTMTAEELHQVPNARDPWGVLWAVPGVLVDRVNVAGSENGQQSNFAAKGATRFDNNFNLDGLVITDMSATGASPAYYDMGAFQEINVTTGANDLQVLSGGIGVNMVTMRGTNRFHGGARMLIAHDDFAFSNLPSALDNDSRLANADGSRRDKADHIQQISDYGFELGGPIIKDKLWFSGSWGKQDIRIQRLTGTPDKTLLPSYNAKLNWQVAGSTMVSLFTFDNDKTKEGRDFAINLPKADSALWNQAGALESDVGGPNRPPGLWKLQIDHTFSPNFFVSANAAYYNTGFTLDPRGGTDQSFTADYVTGIVTGSYSNYTAVRPQKHFNLNGNYFFESLGGNHELKFGFGYRNMKTTSGTHYGGDGLAGWIYDENDYEAWVVRDRFLTYGGKYIGAYIGDVFTKDRMTLNLGLRYDIQNAKNLPGQVPANAAFPNVLGAIEFQGDEDNLIDWRSWSPRVGFSYALDESRRTVLRTSYAYYADQLSFGDVDDENPLSLSFLAYDWIDRNADRVVQPNEVDFNNFRFAFGVNPANPNAVGTTANKLDRNWSPKRDHEFVLGIDREVAGNFAVGAAYTFRRASDWTYTPRLSNRCPGGEPTMGNCTIITPEQYTADAPVTANGYTATSYRPAAALVTAGGSGRIRTNAPGYSTTYNGFELTMTKRLSNRWMSRAAFSFNDWKENWDGMPYSLNLDDGNPMRSETDQNIDGGQVTTLGGASGKAAFYTNIRWQFYGNALWQGPWGVDLSGAFIARQGGAYPVSLILNSGSDGNNNVLGTPKADTLRYDNVYNLDLRLAKTIRLGAPSLTLSAEWFNALNNDVVLARYRFANQPPFINASQGAVSGQGRIEEIIVPSTLRFGATFSF